MSIVSACVGCGGLAGDRYGPDKSLCWECWERLHPPNEPKGGGSPNGDRPTASDPVSALASSRVDLLKIIREGIPPRKFIPGSAGMIVAGKRHHIAAAKKLGKSLTIGVVGAVEWIAAGATVAILDRENGSEEYARRLECVLDAHEMSEALREEINARYRYHAWPRVRLEWATDPGYPVRRS
jgi:hypothetical protein